MTVLTPEERRIQTAIRSIGEVRADPLFRAQLKRDFIAGALMERPAAEPRPESRRSWQFGWVLVPAAAVAMLIFVVLGRGPAWVLHSVTGQGTVVVDGQPVSAADTASLARLIGPGSRIEVPEGVILDLRAGDTLLLELDEQAAVTIPQRARRWLRKPLLAEVYQGEFRLMTGPDFPGHQLQIDTAEGKTEVIGTTVSVFKGEDLTCVCVFEGSARIGKDEANMELVPQGMRKVMFADDRPSMVTEIKPMHQQGLEGFLQRNRETFR